MRATWNLKGDESSNQRCVTCGAMPTWGDSIMDEEELERQRKKNVEFSRVLDERISASAKERGKRAAERLEVEDLKHAASMASLYGKRVVDFSEEGTPLKEFIECVKASKETKRMFRATFLDYMAKKEEEMFKDDVNEPSSEWDHVEDPWVDLEPLILLELRKIRDVLLVGVSEELWSAVCDDTGHTEDEWRTQMKALGRWDERYEP
jgi:hypothetical protein